jgi:hypothetical protein
VTPPGPDEPGPAAGEALYGLGRRWSAGVSGAIDEHRDEDREAGQRVVHEDDLTHAAQA